jgi:hypothetical protein
MKNMIFRLALLLVFSFASQQAQAIISVCDVPECPEGCGLLPDETPFFSRTYHGPRMNKRSTKTNKQGMSEYQGVLITKQDFLTHLALDKSRTLRVIPLGNNIPMDVKGIDDYGDTPQTWDMPDFNSYATLDQTIEHVAPAATGFLSEFPGSTHSFYIPSTNAYEMFELTDDDLFQFGTIRFDDNDDPYAQDIYLTASPVPLEWGWIYEGIVTFIYTDDPDIDSMQFIQIYDAVAFGTLNTYDDGPVDAVKLNFTHEQRAFKDGQVVEFVTYDEIVWYSKEGHYLRGSLLPGMPSTGSTIFAHMEYQKINEASASKQVVSSSVENSFPNPLSAGETLTLQLGVPIQNGLLKVFDVNGKMVASMSVQTTGEHNAFQVQVPENLSPGIYAYQLFGSQSEALGGGKVLVK